MHFFFMSRLISHKNEVGGMYRRTMGKSVSFRGQFFGRGPVPLFDLEHENTQDSTNVVRKRK